MAVRPVTEQEAQLAYGEPATTWLGIFGATQGLLTHLRLNGLTFGVKNLMPTPFAKASLPVCMLGGYLVGSFAGVYFFGDEQLRRLQASHEQDARLRTSAQKYTPFEKI